MEKEKALETVTHFRLDAHMLRNILAILRAILEVALCPIISTAGPNCIRDNLPRLKQVAEFTAENFVVDYTRLHINDDGASSQVVDATARR